MLRKWVVWLLAGLLVLGFVTLASGQDERPKSIPNTPDELFPGLPLDGSIIIEETFWLRLVGEPGRLMRDAQEQLRNKEHSDSAASLRNAASFLHIAADNASELAKEPLKNSAGELDRLSDRVADGSVESSDILEAAFARAHYALARHHVLKATGALEEKQYESAGGYLGSAMNHFQRAAAWSDRQLKPESVAVVKNSKGLRSRLLTGKPPAAEAAQMIKNLRERIKALSKYIEPAPPTTPTESNDESMP